MQTISNGCAGTGDHDAGDRERFAAGLAAGLAGARFGEPAAGNKLTGLCSTWLHKRCRLCGHSFRIGDPVQVGLDGVARHRVSELCPGDTDPPLAAGLILASCELGMPAASARGAGDGMGPAPADRTRRLGGHGAVRCAPDLAWCGRGRLVESAKPSAMRWFDFYKLSQNYRSIELGKTTRPFFFALKLILWRNQCLAIIGLTEPGGVAQVILQLAELARDRLELPQTPMLF